MPRSMRARVPFPALCVIALLGLRLEQSKPGLKFIVEE